MIRRIWDVMLTVSDLKRAVNFYENILGLQKKYEYKDYAGFDCGGVEIGLRTWGGLEDPRKGEPSLDFLVDNVDEACEKLKEKGVKFTIPPSDAVWGARFAIFNDPDGNTMQLVQVKWAQYFEANVPRP